MYVSPPPLSGDRPRREPTAAPPFTAAQWRYVTEQARPMLRASLRKGLASGMLLGAVLTCIVLWLLGLGHCP